MPLLAECQNCGGIFDSRLLGVASGGSAQVTISDCWESCPGCGGMAKTLDGEFLVTSDMVEVLTATPMTWAVIQRLNSVLSAAGSGSLAMDDVVSQIGEIAPWLQHQLDALDPRTRKWFLAFLAFVISTLAGGWIQNAVWPTPSADDIRTIDRQEIHQAVNEAIQRGFPVQQPTTPPPDQP